MKKSIWRKTVAYIVAFVMIISGMPNVFATSDVTDFVDFPTGWSREAVTAAVGNGLLYGRTDTTIEPQGNLTRGEMATIINRAFGSKIEADISSYTDVHPTDWYYHEIAKAVNMQVLQGDGTGLMRPEHYITREEVAAVIARALVLESSDYSVLGKYNDNGSISDWAKPYISILTQKGYMQGNDFGDFCAKDNITREEFAQLMHNIFKTYYTDNGEYNKVGMDSAVIRTTNVTLKDMTIDGDLVLGDGVGKGIINLENVEIKGRLLCRGGEDAVTLKNTTVGEFVVVKDVNGIVNFHNYRDEAPFKGIVEITPATFLKRTSSGGGGGGGGGGTTTKFDVEIIGAGKDGTVQVKKNANFTFPELSADELAVYSSFAGWIVDNDMDTLYAPGSKYKVTKNIRVEAVFYYDIEHYYQREVLSDNYDIDSSLTVRRYAKNGTVITVAEEDLSEKDYYKHNGNQVRGTVSDTSILTLKVYYNINTVTVSFEDEDGSSVYSDITGRFESEITLPKADEVTKDGYILYGWKDEDGVIYPEGGQFTLRKNETLTAYWTQDSVSGYVIEIYKLKVGGTPGTYADYEITQSTSVRNVAVGEDIVVIPDDIIGFEFNSALSNVRGTVAENEIITLKLYYDRITIDVTYDTNGGTPIAATSVQYGAELVLPDSDSTTLGGKVLVGWTAFGTTFAPGATVEISEVNPVEFKAVWENAPAVYAYYKIEYYQQNVDAANGDINGYTLFETKIVEDALVGSQATAVVKNYKGFKEENTYGFSVLTDTVKEDGSLTLKVYYDRVVINVRFDENGGTPDMTDVTIRYGAILKFPGDSSFVKEGYELVGWQAPDGVIYPAGYELAIESETDVEYVAYWKHTVVRVSFDENGGTPDIADFDVIFGNTFTLPTEEDISNYGHYLYKWEDQNGVLYNPGQTVTVDFAYDITFTANWVPLGQYAYVIQYYQQNLEGNGYELYNTSSENFGFDGEEITLDVSTLPVYTGFTFDSENADNVLAGIITSEGLILKVYYLRNKVTVSFDLNGGTALDSSTDSYKVYFGSTITLPEAESVEKQYSKLSKWIYDTQGYDAGAEFVIDSDPEGGYVFVADWELLTTYEVIFYDKWFIEANNVSVLENDTVPENEFPDDKLFAVTGYKENAYISPSLYSGENEYVHEVYTDWYFEHPSTGEYILFTETVPVSADIVVDGILEVYPMSPMIDIDIALDFKNINEAFNFSAFYEATVVDTNGNVISGTRFMDTVKDILWANLNSESGEDSQIKAFAKGYIDRALAKLSTKGIIDEDHNINILELFIKFAQIIGEEELEDYIIDNAKKTLSGNDDLKKYIFDYFETIANSGSEDDIKELEGLLEETIKGALDGEDSDEIMQVIEELCIKMLNSPEMLEKEIEIATGMKIDITEEDLTANAKATILSWAGMLFTDSMLDEVLKAVPYNKKSDGTYVYTSANIEGVTINDFIINIMKDADFTLDNLDDLGISRDELFESVKTPLIDEIIEKLESDEEFFNKSVKYVFAGTPFESFTKDAVKENTIGFFKDVIAVYFDSLTIKELSVKLGYDSEDAINDFYRNHKNEVIAAIIYELDNKPAFFEHVISKTEFADYITYEDVHTLGVKELIKKFVGAKLTGMSGTGLADDSIISSVISDIDSIKTKLVEKLETDDTFFDTVMSRAFAGTLLDKYSLANMPSSTLDFVKKVVEEKIGDLSEDELAKLAEKGDKDGLLAYAKDKIANAIIDNLKGDVDGAYSDLVLEFTGMSAEYIDECSPKEAFQAMLKKLAEDAKESGDYEELKSFIDPEREDWSEFNWGEFFDNFDTHIESDAILEEYLLNISYGKYTFDESEVDKSQYPDATKVPKEPRDFFIGLVKIRLDENLDETLGEYGYDDDKILDEAKAYAKDIIIDKLENDPSFLKGQIEEIAGVTLADVNDDSRTLIADIIDAKLSGLSAIDDSFAKALGYSDLADLLGDDDVKAMIIDEAIGKIESDEDFLKEQIREYTGISYTELPENSMIFFDDIVTQKVIAVDSVDDKLADQLGYDSADELLEAAKPGVIEVVIGKLGDDIEKYRRYITDYIGTDFGEIPAVSMGFIKKYARNVLDSMTEDQIREELRLMGYTKEEIDDIIEDEISDILKNPSDDMLVTLIKMVSEKYSSITSLDEIQEDNAKDFIFEEALYRIETDDEMLKEILTDKFGFVPENFFDSTYTTKQFLVDVIIYIFEHDETKRDSIIDQAVVELIEGGDLSALEDYVDYAVDYLDSQVNPDGTTKLDEVIDEVIESRYRETLDKMVYQLIKEDTFEIDPSTSFILSAFEMQVKAYSFDELIKGVPEAIFKIYPREKLEEIYNRAYDDLLRQIEEGKIKNANGETAEIATGLSFIINPIDDVYVPLRDRAVEILSGVDKLNNFYYYAENEYLQELINLTDASNLVDTSSESESGYKLKNYNDYYDLILRGAIIGDDALCWYTEELTDEELDKLMLSYEDLAIKYANAVADMIETYATDGTLPNKLDNKAVNAVKSAIESRFPGVLDKALNWYLESPINKDYNEDDYEKLRSVVKKAVNKVFVAADITTDEVFNGAGKLVAKLVDAFKEKDDKLIAKLDEVLDNVTKISDNVYQGTLRGRTVTLKHVGDKYEITFKDKTVTVDITGENEYTISAGNIVGVYNSSKDQYAIELEDNSISVTRSVK